MRLPYESGHEQTCRVDPEGRGVQGSLRPGPREGAARIPASGRRPPLRRLVLRPAVVRTRVAGTLERRSGRCLLRPALRAERRPRVAQMRRTVLHLRPPVRALPGVVRVGAPPCVPARRRTARPRSCGTGRPGRRGPRGGTAGCRAPAGPAARLPWPGPPPPSVRSLRRRPRSALAPLRRAVRSRPTAATRMRGRGEGARRPSPR